MRRLDNLLLQAQTERFAAIQQEYRRFLVDDGLVEWVSEWTRPNYRDAFLKMDAFTSNLKNGGKIGVLYGLRRTGKTVVLAQLAEKYIRKGVKVAYATYGYRQHDFNAIIPAIQQLVNEGYNLILLDEISRASGFLDCSMMLSDIVCAKVIIAGTDSLMVRWAMQDALFGRTCVARTTGMSYTEYKRLFPQNTIDRFLRDGGVLWDGEPESVEDYLRTSVVENIRSSIDMLDDGAREGITEMRTLGLLDSDALYRLLVAVCELGAEPAIMSNLAERWGEPIAWQLTAANRQAGGIKNDPRIRAVKDGMQEYYMQLPVDGFDPGVVETMIKRLKDLEFFFVATERDYGDGIDVLVPTQPFIRRDFVRRVISVIAQKAIPGMRLISEKLDSLCDGYVCENVVHMEARERYFDKQAIFPNVFKFRDGSGEIDVCIYQADIKRLSMIEVKYSIEKVRTGIEDPKGQDRWLLDPGITADLVGRYAPHEVVKLVLYRGPTDAVPNEMGIRWVNVEEWLLCE